MPDPTLTGIHSGKFATVSGEGGVYSTTRGWTINQTVQSPANVASNTAGGTFRRKGNKDWTGTLRAFGAFPLAMPNSLINPFTGYTAPADDIAGDNGQVVQGIAMCESVEIQFNWATADCVSHTINFGANGFLTFTDDLTPVIDDTDPAMATLIGKFPTYQIQQADLADFANIENVTDITLSIRAAVKPFVNSSTLGQTFRRAGPFDMDVMIRVQTTERSIIDFQPNDNVALTIPSGFEGSNEFWMLKYLRVQDFSNLEVNRETGDIIAQTIKLSMNGFDFDATDGDDDSGDGGNGRGVIIMPGGDAGVQWWPPTGGSGDADF